MKDENGREYSDYDIDKLIEEYSNINRKPEPQHISQPPQERKKFVVHIDESLIDEPQKEQPKPQSGGIYFSNYQKHRTPTNNAGGSVPVRNDRRSTSPSGGQQTNAKRAKGQKINKVKNGIERVGGKAAVGFLAFILISTILLSYIGITCIGDMLAINRSEDNVVVDIPAESSYSEIIDILQDNGLIKRKLFCKMFTKFRGFDDETYLSGQYYLNGKMGVEGMLKDIMAAPVSAESISLSFPEGWTASQILEKIEKYDVCDSSKVLTVMRTGKYNYDFINDIKDNNKRYLKLEGYLFPDTYDFYVDADPNYVINKFLDNFEAKWEDEYDNRAAELGFTRDEIITIASIIQKEAANSDQMKVISSVIHNRLKHSADYPTLGCDSTALYVSNYVTPVVGEAQGEIYYNAYDTGAIKGLPPGPICNPGMDAIRAALYPSDTDYYFFAHDKAGTIYTASTYKEHKNNLVKIIKANSSTD